MIEDQERTQAGAPARPPGSRAPVTGNRDGRSESVPSRSAIRWVGQPARRPWAGQPVSERTGGLPVSGAAAPHGSASAGGRHGRARRAGAAPAVFAASPCLICSLREWLTRGKCIGDGAA